MMNKVLVMIAGAALGLSSVAFAADTVTSTPAQPTATTSAPAKAVHHKKSVKKAQPAPAQKAQAAKKHVKKAQPAPAQKAQAAKKHHVKKAKTAKPATTTPAA